MTHRLISAGLLPLMFAVAVGAAELPALPDAVSAAIAKVAPDLAPRLAALKGERTELLKKADSFDKACGHVAAGGAQDFVEDADDGEEGFAAGEGTGDVQAVARGDAGVV